MCLGEVLSLKVVLPGGRGKWCTMVEWHIWIGAGVLDMDKGWAMNGEAGNMTYFSK